MSSAKERPLCESHIHAPGIFTLSEGGGTKFVRYFPTISTQNPSPFFDLRSFAYKKNHQLFDQNLSVQETTDSIFDLELPVVITRSVLVEWKDKDGKTRHYHLKLFPDLDPKKLKESYRGEWKDKFAVLGGIVEELQPHCLIEPFRTRLVMQLPQETQQGRQSYTTVNLVQIEQYGEITLDPSFVDKVDTQGKWHKAALRYRTNLQEEPNYLELVIAEVKNETTKQLVILGCTFNPKKFASTLVSIQSPVLKEGQLDEPFYRTVINPYLRISSN